MEEETKSELTYQDFWQDTIQEIQGSLEGTSEYPQQVFYETFEDLLIESNVFSGMDFHYFETRHATARYKLMHLDYGKVDPTDNSINLLTIDYDPSHISTITNEKRDVMCAKMVSFLLNVMAGYFQDNDLEGDSIFPFVQEVIRALPNADIINLFILSSNVKSNVLKDFPDRPLRIGNKEVVMKLKIIDIQYLFNSSISTRHADPVNIKVAEVNDGSIFGIKCLRANVLGDGYEAYLAVLPGTFLSEIYRLYGGRLLEKNVRSFLSTRGSVNKGIRNTIRTEPNKFFTYNNGIACTAAGIKTIEKEGALFITEFFDLQIINGGQTTASLRNAVLTDRDNVVDLSKVFIPMKLTVITDSVSDEDRDIMVGNISKYSNSQNKVSNSDLNSNSPFYVTLEKLSRKIFTPTMTDGFQTRWYFERSRGQYERDQMELTPAKRKRFKTLNPRHQLMRVIDIAKYYNSVEERPFKVAWGGQVNAEDFQKSMQEKYEKNPDFVNEYFFKKLVSEAILFLETRDIIRKTAAYQEHTGILAQIVTYTVSMLMHLIREKKLDLDWKMIWNQQKLPDALRAEIETLGTWVIGVLTDPKRGKDNVGEWAKLKECWSDMCQRKYSLNPSIYDALLSSNEAKGEELSARKDARFNQTIDTSIYVFRLGSKYWQNVLDAGSRYNKFTNDYAGYQAVLEAIKSCDRNRSINKQSILKDLCRIKKEFEEEGIIGMQEPTSDLE